MIEGRPANSHPNPESPVHPITAITLACLLACAALAPAADDDAKPADALALKARTAFNARQYKETIAHADAALQVDPNHFAATYYRAVAHDQLKAFDKAIAGYTKLIALDGELALSDTVRADDRRGDCYLKAGRMDRAIADFDAYLKRKPDDEPYHWRRGIAFYYAKAYERGVKQFQTHKTVNADDVENSVWHFLCNAKLVGVEKARAALIPLEGKDARVPMMTVYEMFAGRAEPKDVLAAAGQAQGAAAQSESALFYAHLYVGLYHEAMGHADEARRHLVIAATKHTSPFYMGDVARVHVKLLNEAVKKDAP